MDQAKNTIKWITGNFFFITIAIFIIIYLRWFRLTPLVFSHYNDANAAYIAGLILLGIYGFFAFLIKLFKNRQLLKAILSVPAAIFLCGNILHAMAFFPSLDVIAKCNGSTYYITWMHPFGDYQWTFYNLTIWRSFLEYDSSFFGYLPGAGPYKIICDEERNEANIIRTANDVLVHTDGENPRSYDQYAGIEFKGYQYFLEWQCNTWSPTTCDMETYTLYQCDLDFKSCDPLPLQYTTENGDFFLVFETDETVNEISLYDDFDDNPDRNLIFTYGEHPHCYADGCEILEK